MTIKIHNNQAGIAHTLLIAAVLVLAGVGGAGYYVMTKQKDKSTSSSAATAVSDKAIEAECKKEINDKDFCKFASNWSGLENYSSVITSKGKEGESTMTLEAESDSKSRMTTKENGKETASFITIGNTFYTKDYSDNSWTKFTSDSNEVDTDIKDDVKIDFDEKTLDGKNKTEYKKIGTETCGNLKCFKYQIIDSEDTATEQFIWFDTNDYLLRRLTTKEGSETTEMTFTYGKVSITEPSPVKEVSTPNGSITDTAELQKQLDAAMREYDNSQE